MKLTEPQWTILNDACRNGSCKRSGRSWPAIVKLRDLGLTTHTAIYQPGPSPGIGGRDVITITPTDAGRAALTPRASTPMSDWLPNFVAESNRIEGILRAPTKAEIEAHLAFLETDPVTIDALIGFVAVVQPNARIRDKTSVPGVRVGSHIAPPSSPDIRHRLEEILRSPRHPYHVHHAYETLHPFTDGNGRSGRVLWLWQMLRTERAEQAAQLGFLHTFYYQTLEHARP